MTIDSISTLITQALAIVGTIVLLYKLNRIERPSNDADLVQKYQAIAKMEADNSAVLKRRIDELEERLNTVEAQWAAAEQYVEAMDRWGDEVLAVMRAHGMQPAAPKPSRKRIA